MLKLKPQYFGHLMWGTDSFEKTLMLGKIEGRRRRRWRMRWLNDITDFLDMSLSKLQELVMDRKPGMLQKPMGSQRVAHDWATELKWPMMEYYSALKKKKILLYATRWISLEEIMHKNTINAWFHLNEVSRLDKLIETENRMVVSKGWKEGKMRSCCLIGAAFYFCKIK